MMLCGTPNLKMIFLTKLTVVSEVELVMGTASIHFVNLSTTTNRCVLPPFDDFLSGPTMSSPHLANDQDSGMVCWQIFGKQRNVARCLPRFSWRWSSKNLLGMPWTRALGCSRGAR